MAYFRYFYCQYYHILVSKIQYSGTGGTISENIILLVGIISRMTQCIHVSIRDTISCKLMHVAVPTRQSEMANTSPRHMPVLGNVHPIKIK